GNAKTGTAYSEYASGSSVVLCPGCGERFLVAPFVGGQRGAGGAQSLHAAKRRPRRHSWLAGDKRLGLLRFLHSSLCHDLQNPPRRPHRLAGRLDWGGSHRAVVHRRQIPPQPLPGAEQYHVSLWGGGFPGHRSAVGLLFRADPSVRCGVYARLRRPLWLPGLSYRECCPHHCGATRSTRNATNGGYRGSGPLVSSRGSERGFWTTPYVSLAKSKRRPVPSTRLAYSSPEAS